MTGEPRVSGRDTDSSGMEEKHLVSQVTKSESECN